MARTKARSDVGSFACNTSSRVGELILRFEHDFRRGTSDIRNFKSMDDLELALSGLVGNTVDEYRTLFENLTCDIDEKEIIRKKKEEL